MNKYLEQLKPHWEKISTNINTRNTRERFLVMIVGVIIIYMAWNIFLVGPLTKAKEKLKVQKTTITQKIRTMNDEVTIIQAKASHDPNKEILKKQKQLKKDLEVLNSEMALYAPNLIEANKMSKIFSEVLDKDEGLKLVRLDSLGSQELALGENAPKSLEDISEFFSKRGMVIEFTGKYFSTLDYLKRLEKLKFNVFWDSIDYNVKDYPNASIKIQIHTIGKKRGL